MPRMPPREDHSVVELASRVAAADAVVGYVASVSGAKASGVLAPPRGAGPELDAAMQIGAVIKIPTRRSVVFGIVNGLAVRAPSSPPSPDDTRTMDIDLFGEMLVGEGGKLDIFQRGVSVYPSLGERICPVSSQELAQIYARPAASNVRIGSLHQDRNLPAYVMTDKLLGEHFAVLGTSGSGKSCTVTLLLKSVLSVHPAGHVVLLDPHNEYAAAFGDMAEAVNTDNLVLPFWLLNFEEACAVMASRGGATAEAERNILKEAILGAKVRAAGGGPAEHFTIDTPVPYRLSDLLAILDEHMGRLNKAENTAPYLRIKQRVESLRSDKRFAFMFSALMMRDIMPDVLSRLLRVPVEGRPLTIVDLSGVPSEIVDVVVSVLVRMIFDFAVWSDRGHGVATLLVCEEAHRYIPRDESSGFAPTRRAIAVIAKEGRKYGVSLGLVTQRPSEISETILSQCNTLFALRMSNDRDQAFVQRALPESAMGFIGALPALHRQEAIVVGEGVTLPMRVRFDDLPEGSRPRSWTTSFAQNWQQSRAGKDQVADIIDRWRRQAR
jgi:DNA helicase HerA-like ATPase